VSVSRLATTVRLDVLLQWRNGFVAAVAFVLVCWLVLLTRLPAIDWAYLLPPVLLGNLSMVSFYFIGGLVLLEKGEGTLEAQIVTPLSAVEYLISKVITLTALSVIESLVIVTLAHGGVFHAPALTAGVAAAAVIYTLLGFLAVARYHSINEYIVPSVFYVILLSLPLLRYFGIWEGRLLYLHPLQGSLLLMTAAFRPIQAGELAFGLSASAAWIVVLFVWSRRAFRRFVISREGTS
jgi:fluoroquinolone transport system permease protein